MIQSGSWIGKGPINNKGNGIIRDKGFEDWGITHSSRSIRHERKESEAKKCRRQSKERDYGRWWIEIKEHVDLYIGHEVEGEGDKGKGKEGGESQKGEDGTWGGLIPKKELINNQQKLGDKQLIM